MKAAILTIGDEILNGQTVDTNSSWIGTQLTSIGIEVTVKISVGDTKQDIVNGLDFAFSQARLVLITGGLGPTHDDITKETLAGYMGRELVFHQETYDRIEAYLTGRGRTPTKAHRTQCFLPTDTELITNPVGTAPGMWMRRDEQYILSMPGVPREMKEIMTSRGLEEIRKLSPGTKIHHEFIKTVGYGESRISEEIADILADMPPHISLAFLPGIASVKVRITAIGTTTQPLESEAKSIADQIYQRISRHVYSRGTKTLPQVIGLMATSRGLKIGTAESCTGGSIAREITAIPGSSAYFIGSIVAYHNDIKSGHLGVPDSILETHGAVSGQTVSAMVRGLIAMMDIDVAIAVSGIAGPSGGTVSKPVGTIWIAVGDANQKLHLSKNRSINIDYTVVYALNLLRKWMILSPAKKVMD